MRKFLVAHKPTGEKVEVDDVPALAKHMGVAESEIPIHRLFKATYGDYVVFEYLKRSDGSYVR